MSRELLKLGVFALLVNSIASQAGFSGGPTSVPGVCICATSGSCSLAGGGAENDGYGQLDARIMTNGQPSGPTGSMDNTGLGVIGTGISLVAWSQASCDANMGLERCCPPNGYTCGIRYPAVPNAPQPQPGQASFGAYPFQGAILTLSNAYLGSGVAIDQFHVLTAAHKINNISADARLKVRMGDWDITGHTEPLPIMEFTVLNVTIHPQFNVGNLKNNIAILTLVQPIPFGQYPTMNNICLPNTTISNMRCMVAGWGRTDPVSGAPFQNIMKEVDLPLVPTSLCQDMLRQNTRLGPNFALDGNSFICAGGEAGKDACIGDGGGPLSCFIVDRFYLVGLTAWGIGCGKANVPGVYVNVQTYIPWIQQFIAAENRMASNLQTTRAISGTVGTTLTTTRRMGGGILTTTTPPLNSSSNSSTTAVSSNGKDGANVATTTRSSSVNASSTSRVTANSSVTSPSSGSTVNSAAQSAASSTAPRTAQTSATSNQTIAGTTRPASSNNTVNSANTTRAPVANSVTVPSTTRSSNQTTRAANSTNNPVGGGVITTTRKKVGVTESKTTVRTTIKSQNSPTVSGARTTVRKVRNTVRGARILN